MNIKQAKTSFDSCKHRRNTVKKKKKTDTCIMKLNNYYGKSTENAKRKTLEIAVVNYTTNK